MLDKDQINKLDSITKKLLEKKAQDKQAELDAIRAQRDYDEAERKAILKEKKLIIILLSIKII